MDTLIYAEELVVADFINNWELAKFRGYDHFQKQWLPHWVAEIYGEKIKQREKVSKTKRVCITRSQAKYRKIENEQEVTDLFVGLGFEVYNLEIMSVKEQAELFANASVVASVHGAGLANMVFAPHTATIFEIFPEYYHDTGLRILAKTLDLKYHYLIGETKNVSNVHPQQENIFVNPKLLKEALNTILVGG